MNPRGGECGVGGIDGGGEGVRVWGLAFSSGGGRRRLRGCVGRASCIVKRAGV